MPTDYCSQFFATTCAGLGLFLVGGTNLLLIQRSHMTRIAATLVAVGGTLAAANAVLPGTVTDTLAVLLPVLGLYVVLRSRRVADGVQAFQRPVVAFGLMTFVGIGVAVGSLVAFDAADQKATSNSLADLDVFDDTAPVVVVARSTATTDRGTPITLREPAPESVSKNLSASEARMLASTGLVDQVMRRGVAGEYANCHGWVFTGAKFRVSSDDVQRILDENGYREVRDPRPGDVVIYRQNGNITHSAIVRYVTEGQPVLVEGKWGALGILLHAVEKSVYGCEFAYYRSERMGHSLAGIDGRSLPATKIQRTVATE